MRGWFEKNHDSATELLVGFHKVATGRPTISWAEAVDQALCFGWIDGVRRSVDDGRYTNRFTPRRPGSNWSRINVDKVKALQKQGLMTPAGLAAFRARTAEKTATYSYERDHAAFDAVAERAFRRNKRAWSHFSAQAPWYRRTATYWVVSAKREETRAKRLAQLIEASAAGEPIRQLDRRPKR